MIAKKILPINPNPSIRTCIHHAYPTAIIESDLLANLSIRNEKVEAWETSIKNVKFSVNDNEVSFYQLEPGKAVCAFWRDLKLEEDIIIDVKYLKKRDFIRHIDIFVASDEIENELSLEDKSMGVRWNTYGYFKRKEMYAYDTNLYTFIRFARKDQMITCYASSDGKNWTTLFSSVIEENQYSKIGIDIDFGDDRYNDWKIMNYIQLLYNTSNEYKGISLDYYFFPRKNIDNSYMYYSNYLDTIYDNKTELADLFGSIHDMLHWNISHGYYVNMCLDEFYVPDRAKYQRGHYNHYNLFYGYDDEEKLYYIMGYGKKGSPIISTIPFSMISYEIINNENIVRYKYAINEITHFEFDIKRLMLCPSQLDLIQI